MNALATSVEVEHWNICEMFTYDHHVSWIPDIFKKAILMESSYPMEFNLI